ncbi:uracil transporter, partial [Acetonema longum DSM 6540]
YTKSRNLILTSVVLISGISGAAVKFGTIELKGMALGTIVAVVVSLTFEVFTRMRVVNDLDTDQDPSCKG